GMIPAAGPSPYLGTGRPEPLAAQGLRRPLCSGCAGDRPHRCEPPHAATTLAAWRGDPAVVSFPAPAGPPDTEPMMTGRNSSHMEAAALSNTPSRAASF